MHSVLYSDAVGALELYIIYLGERLGHTAIARPAVKLKPGRSRPILRRTTYQGRLMQEFSAGTIIVVIPVRRLDVRASKMATAVTTISRRETQNRRKRACS
jgi:hypothetical protein